MNYIKAFARAIVALACLYGIRSCCNHTGSRQNSTPVFIKTH